MATFQDLKTDIRHSVEDLKYGARHEFVRYIVYAGLAIVAIGIVIAFASAAFTALFSAT